MQMQSPVGLGRSVGRLAGRSGYNGRLDIRNSGPDDNSDGSNSNNTATTRRQRRRRYRPCCYD